LASNTQAQPATRFNVRNFGAAGDGQRTDTSSIDKAIESASDAGSGTVPASAGVYVSGTILLRSDVTLRLDAGATILGTRNLADYNWPGGGRELGWVDSSWPTVRPTCTHGLDVNDSAIVKLQNPDGRTNWVGRRGSWCAEIFPSLGSRPDTRCLGFHRLTALR
jgi:polygalacturonase